MHLLLQYTSFSGDTFPTDLRDTVQKETRNGRYGYFHIIFFISIFNFLFCETERGLSKVGYIGGVP